MQTVYLIAGLRPIWGDLRQQSAGTLIAVLSTESDCKPASADRMAMARNGEALRLSAEVSLKPISWIVL